MVGRTVFLTFFGVLVELVYSWNEMASKQHIKKENTTFKKRIIMNLILE